MSTQSAYDLVLSYPQWQGSGRGGNLLRGALAAAEVCRHYGPLVTVRQAGEGEALGGVQQWTAIRGQFENAQQLLMESRPGTVLTAGGDCAVDIAVIDYLRTIHPNLTVIWVDAHLDANTPVTSPSGSFHGMPVSVLVGQNQVDLPLLSPPLTPARFRYVAASVGDAGDWDFQRANDLKWLDRDEAFDGPLHIHFDLDVLDPGEFPHLAYTDGSMSIDAGVELVRRLARAGEIVGMTITEFAPRDEAAARAGQVIIAALCEASCEARDTDELT